MRRESRWPTTAIPYTRGSGRRPGRQPRLKTDQWEIHLRYVHAERQKLLKEAGRPTRIRYRARAYIADSRAAAILLPIRHKERPWPMPGHIPMLLFHAAERHQSPAAGASKVHPRARKWR